MAPSRLSRYAAIFLLPASLHAVEIQGAEAILKRLRENSTDASQPATRSGVVKKQLDDFKAVSESLPPEIAAARWLAVLDAYSALPPGERSQSYSEPSSLSMQSIIMALPPPSAWDALTSLIEKRSGGKTAFKPAAQAFFATLLKQDPAERTKAFNWLVETIEKDPSADDYLRQSVQRSLASLEDTLLVGSESAPDPVARFIRQLGLIERGKGSYYSYETRIPPLAERADASDLLLRVIRLGTPFEIADAPTHRLAVKVALQNLPQLPKPPWYLIQGTEDLPLYEALAKKYPDTDDDSFSVKQQVDKLYFHQFVDSGKPVEAVAFLDDPRQNQAIASGHSLDEDLPLAKSSLLFDIFSQSLRKNPNSSLWQRASRLSSELGQSEAFGRSVLDALKDPRLTSASIRTQLEDLHLTALLETGRTDEAIPYLVDLMARATAAAQITGAPSSSPADPFAPMDPATGGDPLTRLVELLNRSLRIGKLLNRQELIDAGLNGLAKTLPEQSQRTFDSDILGIFIEQNRAGDAEKILADSLSRMAANSQPGRENYEISGALEALASVYSRSGRHQDVILLLDEAPFWLGADLAQLSSYRSGGPIQLIAAKAFAETGQKDKATEIVRWVIQGNSGNDSAYQLLVSLDPPDLLAFLDKVFAANRFQERPLIWKAHVLALQGKFFEAETIIRQAIAIDPSDGEQGKGDRMRAYSVLADILEKKGDQEQTKFFRNVVAAIRESEKADDWWSAGLNATAIKLYEQALKSFADAYCIQSRLALRYASAGDMEKAARYYQRAFELMPDSFGRIESHCFGCEGAFKGEKAQAIADRVFTTLAGKPDAKPQVFYLLGYLRQSQNRQEEALGFFRKAVAMDPDYINAWKKLAELSAVVGMSAAEMDEISFACFRLTSDPSDLSRVSDIRQLWETLLASEKNAPPPPSQTIYQLRSASARVKADPKLRYYSQGQAQESPRTTFLRQPLISAAAEILEMTTQRN